MLKTVMHKNLAEALADAIPLMLIVPRARSAAEAALCFHGSAS